MLSVREAQEKERAKDRAQGGGWLSTKDRGRESTEIEKGQISQQETSGVSAKVGEAMGTQCRK